MPISAPCARARRGDGDDAPAHELGDLHGGEAGPAGGAEHGNGLPRLQLGAILKRVHRRATGDRNAGGDVVAYPVGDGNCVPGLGRHLLPAAIAADKDHYPWPISRLETLEPKLSIVPATSAPGENGRGGLI